MATKSLKPTPPDGFGSAVVPKSAAKMMQERSEESKNDEQKLAVTLRTDNSFEHHLLLPRSVVEGILDPDTPDAFIEVPCQLNGMKRFLHTSYVKEIDVRGL